MTDTTNLLTVTQAAKLLSISTKTLRRWDNEGIAHALRTPTGHRRFTLEEVQRLMPRATEDTEPQKAA